MKQNYDRSIELLCPVCGGKTFSFDNEIEDGDVTCVECKNVFTREEINAANKENIEVNLNEIKKEVLGDIKKDLQSHFKNNKYFRIK